jgi:hypothetical protein
LILWTILYSRQCYYEWEYKARLRTAWFESYLRGREQRVNANGSTSSSQQLSCGVPQGSVLGPLLFTLYSASLAKVLRSHGVRYHFFADDTQLWLPFRPENLGNAIDIMQKCLDDVILEMS